MGDGKNEARDILKDGRQDPGDRRQEMKDMIRGTGEGSLP